MRLKLSYAWSFARHVQPGAVSTMLQNFCYIWFELRSKKLNMDVTFNQNALGNELEY